MNRPFGTLLVIALALVALVSCGHHASDEPDAAAEAAEPDSGAAKAPETGPDPTVVDADHYTVEFENDQVRILRIAYGPGETSVMHNHPESVAVFLTDHHVSFEGPDGSSEEVQVEAGEHKYGPAEQHLPTNLGDEPFELILVELKGS